jgi:hypothetical protein
MSQAQQIVVELEQAGFQLRLVDDTTLQVHPGGVPAEIRQRLRERSAELIDFLRSRDRMRYTSPETKWPEFRAALRSGALVVCLRCIHYSGPELDALGHCTVYRQEAAPDVPFWCPSFKRKGDKVVDSDIDGPNWWRA